MNIRSLGRRFNKRSEKGAAALEFAIIVPVLLLLVLGLIDIGRLLLVNMSLLSAAQQGARVSAMTANIPDSSLVSTVRSSVPDAIVRLSVLGNCTSPVLGTCVLPSATSKCAGTNTGTTTVVASISFYWITPIELIWRFADSTRGASTDYSQTVTAQCLI
jgi:Flp pilus assembly protein TadG